MSIGVALARPVPAALVTAIVVLPAIATMAVLSTASSDPQPVDFSIFGSAGADLLTGRWAGVFHDPILQAGPFELLPWGVLQLLGVAGQVGWTVALSACGALTAFLTALVLRPGFGPDLRSSVLAGGGTVLLTAVGPLDTAWPLGHPSEVLVPLVWVLAGRLAIRGRPELAAALVAASSGFEVWGVLGAPVVLLAARPHLLRSTIAGAVVLAVLWGPFLLVGPFAMFSYAWPVTTGSLLHLLRPGATSAPWSWRLVQSALAIAAGTAVALLLRTRDAAWGPWVVVAVVVAGRLVLDPVLAGYYWFPALVGVTGALVLAVRRRDLAATAVLALCFALAGDVGAPVVRAASLVVVLLVGATVLRLRGAGRAPPFPGDAVNVGGLPVDREPAARATSRGWARRSWAQSPTFGVGSGELLARPVDPLAAAGGPARPARPATRRRSASTGPRGRGSPGPSPGRRAR